METRISNKKFVLTTEAGYMYTPDKKKKTNSSELMAEWLGCKEEDIVCCFSERWDYDTYLIEADPEGLPRVKVTFWKVCRSRPKDEGDFSVKQMVREKEEESSFLWVYADGSVEGNFEKTEVNNVPHKLTSNYYFRVENLKWHDYLFNFVDLSGETVSYGNKRFSKETKEILKKANFPEICVNPSGYEYSLDNMENFIAYLRSNKGKKQIEKITKHESEFKPFKKGEWFKIEKTTDGTLFRIWNNNNRRNCWNVSESYEDTKGSVENARLFINNSGAINQSFLQTIINNKGESRQEWITKNTHNTEWFYVATASYLKKHGLDVVKDIVKSNPKFKYINEWLNKNIGNLFAVDRKGVYGYSGIVEFLRFANSNPVFTETMIKLGYGDEIFINRYYDTVYDDAYDHMNPGKERKYHYDCKTSFNSEDFSGKNSPFGKLAKKSDLLGCLGINKEQWNFIINEFKKSGKEGKIWEARYLEGLGYLKMFFTGEGKENSWRAREAKFAYEKLSDVPLNKFKRVYDVWLKYATSESARGWYYHVIDLEEPKEGTPNRHATFYSKELRAELDLNTLCEDTSNDFIHGNVDDDEAFLVIEKCIKSGIKFSELRDYHNMRRSCERIEGFHIEDWPVVPKDKEQLRLFHDRLITIYNMEQNERRARAEENNQIKYNEILKKIEKFNYEEDNDERCVMVPTRLIEIVSEGQRLHHCVGSYTNSVASGNEYIMFLRKKTDKDVSYATIDIASEKNGSGKMYARQIHTDRNGPITKEDVEFLKRWAKKNNIDEESIKENYGALCAM